MSQTVTKKSSSNNTGTKSSVSAAVKKNLTLQTENFVEESKHQSDTTEEAENAEDSKTEDPQPKLSEAEERAKEIAEIE